MSTTTDTNSRTARLLALMKKGDDAFNARDFTAVDEVHHPDMVAYITGLAEPVYGKEAHAAAMQQMLAWSPTSDGRRYGRHGRVVRWLGLSTFKSS